MKNITISALLSTAGFIASGQVKTAQSKANTMENKTEIMDAIVQQERPTELNKALIDFLDHEIK
jgi:hypothetical protein